MSWENIFFNFISIAAGALITYLVTKKFYLSAANDLKDKTGQLNKHLRQLIIFFSNLQEGWQEGKDRKIYFVVQDEDINMQHHLTLRAETATIGAISNIEAQAEKNNNDS